MESIVAQTRELKSGYSIPVLGLGTWDLRGSTCERVVSEAVDVGYQHLDTAEMYGNEADIGRIVSKVDRRSLFITSKAGASHLHKDALLDACSKSLDRLQTDYLDLYLVHWPSETVPLEETMDGMQQLVQQGMVRSVGVSNFETTLLRQAIEVSEIPICNNQVEFHPYKNQSELLRFCRQRRVTLTAYSPLARGRIAKDEKLASIAENYGVTPAQVSLRWLLQKGTIVIPKASSREHLVADAELGGWELTDEQMDAIDQISVPTKSGSVAS